MKNLVIKGFILAAILPISAMAQLDPATIQKIRTEGLEKSQVMDIAFNLTDKSGNRLANSEGYARAANYAIEVLTKNGASNADGWKEGQIVAIFAGATLGKTFLQNVLHVPTTRPYYE